MKQRITISIPVDMANAKEKTAFNIWNSLNRQHMIKRMKPGILKTLLASAQSIMGQCSEDAKDAEPAQQTDPASSPSPSSLH